MESRSRKRQASDTSLGRSAAPKTKKRKKVTKPSSQSSDWNSSSSISTSPAKSLSSLSRSPRKSVHDDPPPRTSESPPPFQSTAPAKSKRKRATNATASKAKATSEVGGSGQSRDQPSTSHERASSATTGRGTSSKTVKLNKRKFMKPLNGSWLTHIASILVYRCVNQALLRSLDPRGNLKGFNWDILSDGLLTAEDLKMVWFFIEREYVDKPLKDLCEELRPFSRLTVEPFLREEMKEKYKGEAPKPPISAYLLFCKAKGPKLKEKHPNVSSTEMAQKLGKKWRSMNTEQQGKYKQQYANLRREYEAKLKAFYEEHPDAKPSAFRTKRRHDFVDSQLSPQERRLKMLKMECPKPPLSAYMLFCKVKRLKVHQRHPNMSAKEVTVKLSQKWKSMGEEDKIKYKQMHLESSKLYKRQLIEFHEKYPDAKELLKKKRAKRKDSETAAATQTRSQKSSSLSSNDDISSHHSAHHKDGENSSSEDESSSDDERDEDTIKKKERGAEVDNYRGSLNEKGSESETSSMSSSEDEDEEEVNVVSVEGDHNDRKKSKSKAVTTKQKVPASRLTLKKKPSPSKPPLVLSANLVGLQEASKLQQDSSEGEDTDLSDVSFM